MKVLVACEYSGTVRDAFVAFGHDVTSCDLLPTERPGKHYQGDVFDIINDGWDLMVAHPPCFRLSKASGAHWKKEWFKAEQNEAAKFVERLWGAPIRHIAIENPVGFLNTNWMRPTQKIHPFYFGDPWMKETCLWLKNLPPLQYTPIANLFETRVTVVEPIGNWVKPGNKRPHRRFDDVKEGGNSNWKDRSRTFNGIAEAMADQWTKYLTQ